MSDDGRRDDDRLRVAYTVEQCWHDVPGGTAVAALRIARELRATGAVDLDYVAGRHPLPPGPDHRPDDSVHMLPLGGAPLYEAWTRVRWPKVESVTGPIDLAHATGLIPCATSAPLVVTIHDVAFLHAPRQFTRHGARLMNRALRAAIKRADRIITSSAASLDDLRDAGVADDRLRLVPLGVDVLPATADERSAARATVGADGPFVLFVGTVEPRKNLVRLVEALDASGIGVPLVVAGAAGWGDVTVPAEAPVTFLGHVDDAVLRGLYSEATVFAYPSEREGFGLPVAEAMAQGTPVVTSAGTSTEEVAGGAAVLVDPFDVASIAYGLRTALDAADEFGRRGRRRADALTWADAAAATLDVYRELV
ncbi:MAG: glycosyltransferase family 1 protein [Actinomycetota bacterium]